MALTLDDKRKALGNKLLAEINKPPTIPERHLLRDITRERIAQHSQSKRLTPEKMQEIADQAFPEDWSRER